MDRPSEVKDFEYIVVGCGGIGSAAVYWLSKRAGKDVLGLERFQLGHDHGGSQDHGRFIRTDYAEECYLKLVRHAYTAFEELERDTGLKLIHTTGKLLMARKDESRSKVVAVYRYAMSNENFGFELLNSSEIQRRFPQFKLHPNVIGLYTKEAGIVEAATANAAHIQIARRNGATIEENCRVVRFEKDKDGLHVLVHTTNGIFRGRRVVIAAGGWTNQVLESLNMKLPITNTFEQSTYVATPNIKDFTMENSPCWQYLTPKYFHYGFPIHGNTGIKTGITASGKEIHPDSIPCEPDHAREKICLDFLKSTVPKAVGPILYTKTCLYDLTPDRKFIIDTLDQHGFPQITLCCGAGHAYKFAGLFGKILSEIAVDGSSRYPIEAFKLDREALTNPDFQPDFHFDRVSVPPGALSALSKL
ncbi:monomeric sarcosine oxidase-like [Glandiceps talaboti]